MRKVRTVGALAAVMPAAVMPAAATHNVPRDISIKYSSSKQKFKGKLMSQVADCRAGIVTLHKVERGPNPIVGSTAASDGRWAVRGSAHGRFYAESESFQAPGGFCPDVRSRVLEV